MVFGINQMRVLSHQKAISAPSHCQASHSNSGASGLLDSKLPEIPPGPRLVCLRSLGSEMLVSSACLTACRLRSGSAAADNTSPARVLLSVQGA